MKTKEISLAIVILNWKSKEDVLSLLESILQWKELLPRIIIVDNESEHKLSRHISNERITLIEEIRNHGYGGGNNIGIQEAQLRGSEFILLLNPDLEITERSILNLLKAYKKHPTAFAIGPVLIEKSDENENLIYGGRNIGKYVNTRIYDLNREADKDSVEVDYIVGAAFLLKSEILQKIGMFDEDYFFSGEIADLCRRAQELGYLNLISLKAKATHHAQPSHLRNTMYLYYNLRNRFIYISKFEKNTHSYIFWTLIIIRNLIGRMLKGKSNEARALFLALLHSITRKFGNQNHFFIRNPTS